jgi:hypothetical protein
MNNFNLEMFIGCCYILDIKIILTNGVIYSKIYKIDEDLLEEDLLEEELNDDKEKTYIIYIKGYDDDEDEDENEDDDDDEDDEEPHNKHQTLNQLNILLTNQLTELILVKDISKPLKPVSYYKVCDLKEMMDNSCLYYDKTYKKQDLYNKLIGYYLGKE